eukprot:1350203-Pyramimonas_sp.AAC.1
MSDDAFTTMQEAVSYVLEKTTVDSAYLALIDDPKHPSLEDLARIDETGEQPAAKVEPPAEEDEEGKEGEEEIFKGADSQSEINLNKQSEINLNK